MENNGGKLTAQQVAAKMLMGDWRKDGLLHAELYETLERLASLCNPDETAIAATIVAWELATGNPSCYDE